MDYEIDVIYEAENEFLPDLNQVQGLITHILKEHGALQAEVSVAFVGDAEIVELNRKFFDKSTTTDVIAFNLLENSDDSDGMSYENLLGDNAEIIEKYKSENKVVEGEIIVNADVAERVAKDFGNTSTQEVLIYIIHGLLHILGYDDLEDEKKRVMWVFQDYYFEKYVKSE